MHADHIVLFVLGALVLAILADQLFHRLQQRKSAAANKSAARAGQIESLVDKKSTSTNSEFAVDETAQFKQALGLSAVIRELEGRFEALKVALPESSRSDKVKREFAILAEQLRIARSYEGELLRHVFSWRGAGSSDFYRPTHAQAAWAYTAAQLTIGFAHERLEALGG